MNSCELAWRIRRHAVEMAHVSHGSHIGSVLSVTDIVAVLYAEVMNVFPSDPQNDTRDRFILSKGHAGAAVYAALAEMGFFSCDELLTHYQDASRLSAHISHKGVAGVEFSTGSLGHGVCVGAGMALAAKKDGKNHRVFCIIGDGECNEGSVWEMALFANQYKLSNLCVIVDHNKQQGLGPISQVMDLGNLSDKWRSFGWDIEEIDGHNHAELARVLSATPENRPVCIVAHTVKGKGVSFMEDSVVWHYKDPQETDYKQAVTELEGCRP